MSLYAGGPNDARCIQNTACYVTVRQFAGLFSRRIHRARVFWSPNQGDSMMQHATEQSVARTGGHISVWGSSASLHMSGFSVHPVASPGVMSARSCDHASSMRAANGGVAGPASPRSTHAPPRRFHICRTNRYRIQTVRGAATAPDHRHTSTCMIGGPMRPSPVSVGGLTRHRIPS